MAEFEIVGMTGYEAAGGVPSYYIDRLVPGGDQVFEIEKRDRFTFVVPPATGTRVSFRDVLKVTDHFGDMTEWSVDYIKDGVDVGGDPATTISAQSSFEDIMRNTGLVRNLSGMRYFNSLGGIDLTATQFLEAFVIDVLSDYGITWVSLGTVDFTTDLYDLAFENISILSAIHQIREATGGEIEWLRPSGSSYTLGLRTTVGEETTRVRVATDKNLVRLIRTRELQEMATVVLPKGKRSAADQERIGIEWAVWEVTAISSLDVTLADPNGGDGPIQFANQLNGKFLHKPTPAASEELGDPSNLWLTEILTSGTNQVIGVRSVDGLALGDYAEIRSTSAGVKIAELENPAMARGRADGGYGRVCRTFERDDLRGERNFIRDPFFGRWTSYPSVLYCRADGSQSNTTSVDAKGLPANQAIKAGDVFCAIAHWGGGPNADHIRITADVTADGSGDATLSLAQAIDVRDNYAIVLYLQTNFEPTLWDRPDATNSKAGLIAGRRGAATTIACQANGAQTLGLGNTNVVAVKGLTAHQVIRPGAAVFMRTNGSGEQAGVLEGATADSSGEASLLLSLTEIAVLFDDDDVTLYYPAVGGVGTRAPCFLRHRHATIPYVSQDFSVEFDSAFPTLYLTLELAAVSIDPGQNGGWDNRTPRKSPRLVLADDLGAEITGLNAADFVPTATGQTVNETLRLEHTMTADDDFQIQVLVPGQTSGSYVFNGGLFFYIAAVQAHLGDDAAAPIVDGSHATSLWQVANKKLETLSTVPVMYEALWVDVTVHAGLGRDKPVLGSWVRLEVPEMSLDVEARIMRINFVPEDAERTTVILDTRPDLASNQERVHGLAPFHRGDYVEVLVVDEDTGDVSKGVVGTDEVPPARTEGARRFDGSSGAYVTYSES